MKVWELISDIKGVQATQDEILDWMVMNKICPLDVDEELEEGRHHELNIIANTHCDTKQTGECGKDCYREFLEIEYRKKGE